MIKYQDSQLLTYKNHMFWTLWYNCFFVLRKISIYCICCHQFQCDFKCAYRALYLCGNLFCCINFITKKFLLTCKMFVTHFACPVKWWNVFCWPQVDWDTLLLKLDHRWISTQWCNVILLLDPDSFSSLIPFSGRIFRN